MPAFFKPYHGRPPRKERDTYRESAPIVIRTGSNIKEGNAKAWANLIKVFSKGTSAGLRQTNSTHGNLNRCEQCEKWLDENENSNILNELCDSDDSCMDENHAQLNSTVLRPGCESRVSVCSMSDSCCKLGSRHVMEGALDEWGSDDDHDFQLEENCSRKNCNYVSQRENNNDEKKINEEQGIDNGSSNNQDNSINSQRNTFGGAVFSTLKMVLKYPLSNFRILLTLFVLLSTVFYVYSNYITMIDYLRDNVYLWFVFEKRLGEVPFYKKILNYLF